MLNHFFSWFLHLSEVVESIANYPNMKEMELIYCSMIMFLAFLNVST